jgi:S1-C subfamily serine protease
MRITFGFVTGARAGQVVEVLLQTKIRLGRQPDNEIVFDAARDLDVSGYHAEVRQEADGIYLYDVGSANGTFSGGGRIERLRLTEQQEVSFGATGPRLSIQLPLAPAAVVPALSVASSSVGHVAPAVGQPKLQPSAPASSRPVETPASAQSAPSAAASPAAQALMAALPPGQKVGARTVAMMIDQAILQAQAQKAGKLGKSTVFVRAMVNQAVTTSTKRFKVISIILIALLIGSVAGFLVLRHFEQEDAETKQEALQKQQTELRGQLAALMKQQKGASEEEKAQLAKKLEDLNKRLQAAAPMEAGRAIASDNGQAVMLLAFTDKSNVERGFCTAFAVKARLLATNAHCVKALERFQAAGMKGFVVLNRQPQSRFQILKATAHPSYHAPFGGTISPDVGLIKIDRDAPALVKIAPTDDLLKLDTGDVMYTFGFPGRLAKVASPAATLVQGVVGRVTRLNGNLGSPSQHHLIQHSAFTSGGTSGSPIFNPKGEVIAVNAGGYVESGALQVFDPTTGRSNKLRVANTLVGYNFGVRADLLLQLMKDQGES